MSKLQEAKTLLSKAWNLILDHEAEQKLEASSRFTKPVKAPAPAKKARLPSGVAFELTKSGGRYRARMNNKSASFSVSKYGSRAAKQMAVAWLHSR